MTQPKRFNKKNQYRCYPGDFVIHTATRKLVYVSEVILAGLHPKERDLISVCRIMDNGQILKRSPICIDSAWRHTSQ